jgi:thioredoxin-related protein
MDKHTFIHPEILKYLNDKFYIVKFNAENDTVNMYNRVFKNPDYHVNAKSKNAMHQFAKFMNINAYPTLFFR